MKIHKQIKYSLLLVMLLVLDSLFQSHVLFAFNKAKKDPVHFEKGKFLIDHITSKEYEAGISNWTAVQDERGVLYFGNQSGVLEYDGSDWRLIKVSNYSTVYSLAISYDKVIYVGAVGELGYLAADSIGNTVYHSLIDKLPLSLRNFEKVKKIIPFQNKIYFQTDKGIFKWDGNTLEFYLAKNPDLFLVGSKIYVTLNQQEKISDSGSIEIKDNNIVVLDQNSFEINARIVNILPYIKNQYIVFDQNGEASIYNDDNINSNNLSSQLPTQVSKILNSNKLLSASLTPQGNYALNIENLGVFILNKEGTILSILNKDSGLPNTSVLSSFFDNEENLWLGFSHGIAKVTFDPGFNYWDENLGLFGEINAISRFKNIVFIATNLGLYYIENKYDKVSRVIKIREIKGNCSSLLNFKNDHKNVLLVGAEDGIYEIATDSNNQMMVSHPSKLSRVKKLLSFHIDDGFLAIKGNSIYLIKSLNKRWNIPFEIKHFRENIIQATYSPAGDLWIVTESGDLFKVKETEGESLGFISYEYDFLKGDIGHRPISIIPTKDKLYIQTQKDLFKYHSTKDIFLRKEQSNIFEDKESQVLFFKETIHDNFWALNKKESQLIPTFYIKRDKQFYGLPINRASIINHDNISKDDILYVEDENDVLWLGGVHKLYRINIKKQKIVKNKPVTLIRKIITSGGEILYNGTQNDQHQIKRINYDQNNLAFYFSLPAYSEGDLNRYSVKMIGYNDEWSEWFPENKFIYSNLQAGEYIFHVKGKGYNNTEGEIATYRFVVIAPWYQSRVAYLFYILFLVSSVWLIVKANTYRLKKEKERLETIIDQRTSEIVNQNEKLEAQRNLLAEKNEEIQNQNENLKSIQEHIEVANIELISNNLELEQEVAKRALVYLENSKEMDRLNRELDTFIYRASHDLKGPVSSMQGLAKLMELSVKDPDVSLYLEKFNDSLQNMDETISKLVLINGITQSQLQLSKVNFEELINEIQQPYLERIKECKIRFEVAISPDIDFYSDEYFLKIILNNLLDNAVTYYRSSQRIDSFIKLQVNQTNKRLNIVIEDNGSGIPKEDYARVFHMFYKGSELSHGNGLGLYIVKKAIEKLDGNISLESKEGAATKISITLSNENEMNVI